MNTPTAQELFRAVEYGQKKNARICEFLSEMLGYTYPALPRTVVKVQQDKNKSTREKLCMSIVRLPQEVKQQDLVRVGLTSLFLVEEYRFNKVLINIADKYRQFLDTCTEYRVAVKNYSASWIYQDFPSILRRSRSSWCLPATDLCDLIITRYNIQYVESKYRLVIAARHELEKLDAQVQECLPGSSIKSWTELIHSWSELIESSIAELKSSIAEPELSIAEPPLLANSLQPTLTDGLSISSQDVCTVETRGEHNGSSDKSQDSEYDCDQILGCFEAGQREVDVLTAGQSQDPGNFQPDAQATAPHGEAHQEDVATVAEQTDGDHAQTGVFPQNGKENNALSDANAKNCSWKGPMESLQREWFRMNATMTTEDEDEIVRQENARQYYWGDTIVENDAHSQKMNIAIGIEHVSSQVTMATTVIDDEAADAEVDIILSGGHASYNTPNTDMDMFSQESQQGTPCQVPNPQAYISPDHSNVGAEMLNKAYDDETSTSFYIPGTDAENCRWKGPMESLQREWFRMNASMTTEDEDEIVRQENQRRYNWGDTIKENEVHAQKLNVAMGIEHHNCQAKAISTDVPTCCDGAGVEHHTYRAKAISTNDPSYIDGASGLCMQYQGPVQFTAEPPVHSSIVRVPAKRAVELPVPHSRKSVRNVLPPRHRLRYHPYMAGSAFRKVAARHSADLY